MNYSPEFLRKVVDLLLPGLPADERHSAIPSASQIGVDGQLAQYLEAHPEAEIIGEVLESMAMKSGGETAFVAASESVASEDATSDREGTSRKLCQAPICRVGGLL